MDICHADGVDDIKIDTNNDAEGNEICFHDYIFCIYKKLSNGKLPDYIRKIMPSAGTDGFVSLPDRSTRSLAIARDRLAREIAAMKKKAGEISNAGNRSASKPK